MTRRADECSLRIFIVLETVYSDFLQNFVQFFNGNIFVYKNLNFILYEFLFASVFVFSYVCCSFYL